MRLFWLRRAFLIAGSVVALACLLVLARNSPAKTEGELEVGNLRVGKILFLGNSITLHGPAPNIGWTGDWGMAASTREKDYVHLLLDRISKASGGKPKVMVRNIADFERNLGDFNIEEALKNELAFEADVVVLAIGENASPLKTDDDRSRFATALQELLAQLHEHGHPRVFVRSQFWPDAEKDKVLKLACEDAKGVFVDLENLGADPANSARAERKIEHEGVAGHPGDKGMAAIAEKIWAAIEKDGNVKD